ncbi:MAG TPA: DNA repair protein RadA, partial [Longimicrobiales bacterium]
MPKTTTVFFCTECGNESPRWQGQCPACAAWNTLVEEPKAPAHRRARPAGARRAAGAAAAGAGEASPVRLADVAGGEALRWRTGLGELDYVLGGGIVPGSLVLVGGEPGVGKSTILLQVAAR